MLFRAFISVAITVGVVIILRQLAADVGIYSFWFALALNWFLMLWSYALSRFVILRLPGRYYKLRPHESEKWFSVLGVGIFRRFVGRFPLVGYRKMDNSGSRHERISALVLLTLGAETAHAIIFVIVNIFTLWFVVSAQWAAAGIMALLNILHNFYPVLLQRQIRYRLLRIEQRIVGG